MCTPNTELKFCTCIEGDIAEIKNIYIWTLYRYYGSRESLIRGKAMMPVKDFQNGISLENISSKLNEGNLFDFDYIPQERDTLSIRFNAENRTEYKYLSLIFRNGTWQQGQNYLFTSIEKNIAKGEVKVIYQEENEFLKHCENLKIQNGIEIPESVKVRCANLKNDSRDPIYLAIKNFKEYKVFYHPDFIKSVTDQYFNEFPESEDLSRFQSLLDEAQTKFSLKEKKFVSEKTDFYFINQCLEKSDNNVQYVFVAIHIKGEEYMIINGRFYAKPIFSKGKRKTYFISKTKKINYEIFKLSKDY